MMEIPLIIQLPQGFTTEMTFGHDIVQMIAHAGPMVKFVMLILALFSVLSWAIIFVKFRMLGKARRDTENFLDLFWENRELQEIYRLSDDLQHSPVARLFRSGYAEFGRIRKLQDTNDSWEGTSRQAVLDNLTRSLKKATIDQTNRLERAVSFLATTGNTAPFIGLFGTVWGIMEAFHGIGVKGSANLAVVAPGISEALIATAAGLAAAIPAVVAFNYFSQKISGLKAEMEIFTTDFLSTVGRRFFKGEKPRKKTVQDKVL